MGRKRQKIVIKTDGTHKNTSLEIDGRPLDFSALTINGSKESNYDIILTLSMSKISKEEVKQNCSTNAVGGFVDDEMVDDYD